MNARARRDRIQAPSPALPAWARQLRRHIGWIVAAKLVLIALLFALFFSAGHRPDVDPAGVFDHFRLSR